MKRTKVMAMVMVFAVGILCTGTLTVKAAGKNCMLGNYNVSAETYACSNKSGMARTVSNGREVYTGVSAIYEYYDGMDGGVKQLVDWDEGLYGSDVTFSLPVGAERACMILAEHIAKYGQQNWQCETVEYFDE